MEDHSPDIEPTVGERESEPQPLIKWGWLRALLFFVAFLVSAVLIAVVSGILLAVVGASKTQAMDSLFTVIYQAVNLLVSFLLVLLFRRVFDRKSVGSLGFTFSPRFRRDLIWGVLFGIGLQLVIFGSLSLAGQIQVTGFEFLPGSLLALLFSLIFAAVQEEIVMRGYMLSNMMKSTNKYLALVLVSAVFALLHGSNPDASLAGVLNILLAGLLLGVYYIHRRNLWFP
ncbi:MAG TPA: type II CAAX endopeptidase family protein, partial [candidate division Zixibacteria bacterium]|nr:type II CAAX endopeptidase family protein [candidate division Zixibacteria bacterium]